MDKTPQNALSASDLERLRAVDTPTICNAIELIEGRRGFDRFTKTPPVASAPDEGAIVGYAITARIAGAAPPTAAPAEIRDRRMRYYRMVAAAPKPAIVVIEDLDGPDAVGAFWGEVNAAIHKGFGLAGALTNGVVRDLGDLPDGFPILAGLVGPSHGWVRIEEMATPVTVLGLAVEPGDLVHADRHGAAVVPQELAPALPDAIDRLIAAERLVIDAAADPAFDLARFEAAWAAFERARG